MKLVNRIKDFIGTSALLKDESLRREFYTEVFLLNLTRLKYFGYFLVLMGCFTLYTDLFLGDFWQTYQVNIFILLDSSVLIAAILIMLVSHLRLPRHPRDIKTWHYFYFYFYFIWHLSWSVGISVVEARTANGVPTYLIGLFAAATIYLIRGIPMLLLFIASLIGLYIGLRVQEFTNVELVNEYMSTIILMLIAWVVSLVLMNTRMRSFMARKEIEAARDNLDQTVKERTRELESTNVKLLAEIKEREKYEKNLQSEKKKAEEADRLKSIFLANMSHEIRTPLNGIIGFGDLLRSPDISEEKKERYLDIIANNGQQLLKIIDDLMDISMIESNQLRINNVEFKLEPLLPHTKIFFENYAQNLEREHLEIINEGICCSKEVILNSDPSRVQQILYNLLSNAVKFTSKGTIRFGCKAEEKYVLIYVEDTGIGVTPEMSKKIFERFRQGEESINRAYSGNGLGLSISQGVAELLGGLLWLDLSYKNGARFCFSLPTVEIKYSPTVKQMEKSCKLLQKEGLIIYTAKKCELGFLNYFIENRSAVKTLSIDSIKADRISGLPETILINTENSFIQKSTAEIFDLIEKLGNRTIIATVDDLDENTRSDLIRAGCSLVLGHPVNLNLLLAFISQNVTEHLQV